MRSERQMFGLILRKAREDERIRAVILNGSRVDPMEIAGPRPQRRKNTPTAATSFSG